MNVNEDRKALREYAIEAIRAGFIVKEGSEAIARSAFDFAEAMLKEEKKRVRPERPLGLDHGGRV
jgi:hypothetical protein